MSSNGALDALAQDVITQLPAVYNGSYFVLCAAVLILYDHLLTFPLELRHIWRGKPNTTRFLFILNRYSNLFSLFGNALLFLVNPVTDTECRAFYYISQITGIIGDLAENSIFTLRTYAIYERSRTVFMLLAILSVVNLTSSIWATAVQYPIANPPQLQIGPLTCGFNELPSSFDAFLANVLFSAIFDVLVILTIYRIGRLAIQSRNARISGSLSLILVRDGMLYYSSIFLPQLASIILNIIVLKTANNTLSDISDGLSYISTSLEAVMVSRLVLSLSQAANRREDTDFRTGLEPPSFVARSFLGNIGGTVGTLSNELDNDALEEEEIIDTEEVDRIIGTPSNVAEIGRSSGIVTESPDNVAGEMRV